MSKIKISILILLIGLIFGGMAWAGPLFNEKGFDEKTYIKDEIIVKFKGDSRPFRVIRVPRGRVLEEIKRYQERKDVIYSEPNFIVHALMAPNDTYYSYQWNLPGIETEKAWDISTGKDAVVAVIDTGVAYKNYGKYRLAPDLAGTLFSSGYDFVNNDSFPNDDNGHGTHIAGTISQTTNNNLGVAGIAFDATIMPIKVLNQNGSGSYANLAEGIRFAADNNAQVINLSLGGSSSSTTLRNALAYAYNKGVSIIAAAGNDNSAAINYPAAYDDYVIAVGATRYDEAKAYYSNYGSSLDLVAPGGDLNVDQNNDGYGDGVLQQTFDKRVDRFGYYFYQGTSMATGHVSGIAALVIANGIEGPDNVRKALETTAKDLGSTGWDENYGWGLVNAFSALGYKSGPSVNKPPTADAGNDQSAYVGETVSFDGSGSMDDNTIVSYSWDFGDNETANGINVSHSYSTEGSYTVTLTVEDDEGLTDSDTVLVSISEAPSQPAFHVGDIVFEPTVRNFRKNSYCKVKAIIPILDSLDKGVDEAKVFGKWSGAYNKNVSAETNTQGKVSFTTRWVAGCGEFTFSVDNVTKDNWLYDSSANVETKDSIILP